MIRRSRFIAIGPGVFNFVDNTLGGGTQVYRGADMKRFQLTMDIAGLPGVPETLADRLAAGGAGF